jgi:hypothetical protein
MAGPLAGALTTSLDCSPRKQLWAASSTSSGVMSCSDCRLANSSTVSHRMAMARGHALAVKPDPLDGGGRQQPARVAGDLELVVDEQPGFEFAQRFEPATNPNAVPQGA